MSNSSSSVPQKPSNCDTKDWNNMADYLFFADEHAENTQNLNLLHYEDGCNQSESFDIQNMDIILADSGCEPLNTRLGENVQQDNTSQIIDETASNNCFQLEYQTKGIVLHEDRNSEAVEDLQINKENVSENVILEDNAERENVIILTNETSDKKLQKNNCKKRKRDPNNWKQNIRKTKRQRGESYINSKGNLQKGRKVKESTCHSDKKCPFKCITKITAEERQEIHNQFWTLSDELKSHFYSKHVLRILAKRKRTTKEISRKSYSYEYTFNIKGVSMRVCQEYFLNTLNISKQRIYYFFKNIQNPSTSIPRPSLSGKHRKKFTSKERENEIRAHIESFPAVESHYCRATTKKKYLERDLNLRKMYNLYIVTVEDPVSYDVYSKIFNFEYNISFFKPKNDLCDKCEEFKLLKEPTEEKIIEHEAHMKRKKLGREERERDRIRYKNSNNEENTCVVTFDLQNVFSLPKAYVGHYYYKSKLCTYNLTGHCNINNTVYNAIWYEYICGRGGTHIASALIKILKAIVKDIPNLRKIILWSDSCVPQNRNSLMSFALQHFLYSDDAKMLESIEHKYGEPGHGNVQEIDSAHSCIERYIKHLEIWTPITLIRILTHMPNHWKFQFKVLQMLPSDYLNYQTSSSSLSYNLIPYSKVKHIIYEKEHICNIKYKESYESEAVEVKLSYKKPRNSKSQQEVLFFPKSLSQLSELNVGITETKKEALKAMLPQMPDNDKVFYEQLISRPSNKKIANKTSKSISPKTTKQNNNVEKKKQKINKKK